MRKFSVLILVAFSLFIASAAFAGDHAYVGPKKCKGCHKALFASWSETPHANSFSKLSAEEQKDAKCVVCHTTGIAKKTGEVIENVACEACHGPGGDYKSAKIMSKKKWKADPEGQKKLALEAGLIMPDEKVCVTCHKKEGNPNYKEFKFAEKKDLVHPPIKEEAKAEGK